MFTVFAFVVVIIRWHSVVAIDVAIITRDTYDLIQFSNCSDDRRESRLNCHSVKAVRTGDKRTCTCKCKLGFITYRDPYVKFRDRKYQYSKNGERGCVWYGNYHEGCRGLRSLKKEKFKTREFPAPILIDLTRSGNTILQVGDHFSDPGCLKVVPSVQIPGTKQWKQIEIPFRLESLATNSTQRRYSLKWTANSDDIYAYQGLVMKLQILPCGQNNNIDCIMSKIAGTYTAPENCKRRTLDGRCCVLPFVYNGVLHNDCITTNDDMRGPWCAVSLNSAVNEGNHKWRAKCRSVKPSTMSKLDQTTSTVPDQSVKGKNPKSTHPFFRSRTPFPTLVTVTAFPPRTSFMVPKNEPPKSSRRGSHVDITLIVSVIASFLVLVVLILLVVFFCLRRRHRQGKLSNDKGISVEDLVDEAPYAYLKGDTPGSTRKLTAHRFVQSMEMSSKKPLRRGHRGNTAPRPPSLGLDNAGVDNFYDTVKENMSGSQNSSIYNIPEADYSLITTLSNSTNRLYPATDDPQKHVYSVLERNNDPLKRPVPVDNDSVFVEANPLYCTIDFLKKSLSQGKLEMSEKKDDKKPEATSPRNIYEDPKTASKEPEESPYASIQI